MPPKMNSLTVVGIVLSALVAAWGGPVPKLQWFPNAEGIGIVPAVFGDTFDFDAAPDANPDDIHFFLWTKLSAKQEEIENNTSSLDASQWDRSAPVKIFAHGFTGTSAVAPSIDVKKAYISDAYPTNVNLILIDWGSLAAAPRYDVAALGTKTVGLKTAFLIDFLVKNGYTTLDKVHVSGHSLGAHVAGYTGAQYQKLSGKKVPRITGLDAALPIFGDAHDENRLDKSDADWVDVLHTNAGVLLGGNLGFREPIGHVDLYPNKGSSQPGCGEALELMAICSHNRAPTLFEESIASREFRAIRCDDDNYKGTKQFTTCDSSKGETIFGEWAEPGVEGIYYFTTNNKSPFAKP